MITNDRPIESFIDELDDAAEEYDHLLGLMAVLRDLLGQVVVGAYRLKHTQNPWEDSQVDPSWIIPTLSQDYPYLTADQRFWLMQAAIFHQAALKWDRARLAKGSRPAWRDDHPLSEIGELNFVPPMSRCYEK